MVIVQLNIYAQLNLVWFFDKISESAVRIAYELAISPVRISAMFAMQRNFINPNAAQDIVDLLVR